VIGKENTYKYIYGCRWNQRLKTKAEVQQIVENVVSSEFTFTIIVTIISVFVPGRSREVQKLKKWVCTV
jgi:hypothetical protein